MFWRRSESQATNPPKCWPTGLNGIFKTEMVKPMGPWRTRRDLEYATFEYVNWYNQRRLHEQIGMIPPAEKEANPVTTEPTAAQLASRPLSRHPPQWAVTETPASMSSAKRAKR